MKPLPRLALLVTTGTLCAPAVVAQTSVPAPTPPPPVTTTPVPSSPTTIVTDQGGGVTTYPLAPQVAPPVGPPAPVPVILDSSGLASVGPPSDEVDSEFTTATLAFDTDTYQKGEVIAAGPLTLTRAFALGRQHDPIYGAAVAERRANIQVANQSIAGYLPSASLSVANVPTEDGLRKVVSVTQPIVSLSGLATLRQRGPRREYAEATFRLREQDLAQRLMAAVADMIKSSEAARLNASKITSLKSQNDRADRLYQAGQGTITDARDIAVRYGQSLANQALLEGERGAAAARVAAITGVIPGPDTFRLREQFPKIDLAPIAELLDRQSVANPQIQAARQTQRINKLEADRILGSLFPVLGASATYSQNGSSTVSYVGLSLTAPFNAGALFQRGAASAATQRSFQELRGIESRAKVELQRLYSLIEGGNRALSLSYQAIDAAQLSVEANSKSYEGGVRTNVDVVNSIQTLYETKNEHIIAATTLATNLLNLLLLTGIPPMDALAATQQFLFTRP